jgi:uncharacterized protein YyaL (SSP411 family)
MANHLADQSSPYLLQHADNPVDWYPWGEEALEKARREDKPIFLSIGYSACHWCHVMERESFEDKEVADLLNENFVSIKVDREERPDLDSIYIRAVSALTGQGGWPLNVWLTPAGAPFFGGTYFPDEPRYGMASFKQVVRAVGEAWRSRRAELEAAAGGVVSTLLREQSLSTSSSDSVHSAALESLNRSFDPRHGGWGHAPKFPQPMLLEYLLMRLQSGLVADAGVHEQVERTLQAMARGGICDHLGGGFHRYSTDDRWLVPHFEKMLYDNAQLSRCYVHAWQLLGNDMYRRVAEETLDYLLAEMRHPAGGFFSSQDADSECKEGTFYTWTEAEIARVLSPRLASIFMEAYSLAPGGEGEGGGILWLAHPPQDPTLAEEVAAAKARLQAARSRRVKPTRDDKILASWNGLALAALADAGRALGSQLLQETAKDLGHFLATELIDTDFKVSRSWKEGIRSIPGYLEDYACLVEGFLCLYQSTFDERWFGLARGLTDSMLAQFRRPEGGFYDTSIEHEDLLVRPRTLQDSPTPSGNSQAAVILLKLAALTGSRSYQDLALETLTHDAPPAAAAPEIFAQWLCARHLADQGLREAAVVGDLANPPGSQLVAALNRHYLPTTVAAARPAGASTIVEMLALREPPVGPRAAAWVCTRGTCHEPTTDPATLLTLLNQQNQPQPL